MKKMFGFLKKLFAVSLALTMIGGSANAVAYAYDTAQNTACFEESCDNPLYSDSSYEGQTQKDLNNINGSYVSATKLAAQTEQQMMKDAAVVIRNNMISRNTSFSVNISSARTDYSALVAEVFDLAVSEELADSPVAGDYLAFQYGSYSYTGSAKAVNGLYEYALKFNVVYYTTASQEAQVTSAVNNALSQMNIHKLSSYEKVKSIYDYVCKVCNYDYSTTNDKARFSAYGALIKKTAVCQGYSTLLYRMLEEAGIDNRIVTGPNHSWNIVNIDGIYYNVDATWDDNYFDKGKNYQYFLKCNAHFGDHNRDAEYKTNTFNAKYPMAADCYADLELVDARSGESTSSNIAETIVFPTTLSSITTAVGSLTVKWTAVPDAKGYQLQYATKSDFSNAKSLNISSPSTVSKAITGLANGTKYYVRIRVYDTVANTTVWSEWSASKNATTPAKPAKAVLSSLTAVANGFTVKWNKISGVTGYQVQYSTRSDFANAATVYGGNASAVSKAVTGRAAGTKYYVRVRAYKNISGQYLYGDWSASKNVTVPAKPKTPSLGAVTGVKKGFTVKWGKVSGVTGYQVQYSTKSNFANAATVYGGNANAVSKTITGRAAGAKYYVRVRAYKSVNGTYVWGNWTSAKAVTTKK